jgi:hypothetical protein
MADDEGSAFIPPADETREARRENRALRRRAERERQAPPPPDIEPEPDPTPCVWCGFVAFFEAETPEEEQAKCPACGIKYESSPLDVSTPDSGLQMMDHALRKRQAFALDRIAGILQEAWDEACDRLGIG